MEPTGNMHIWGTHHDDWCWYIELAGSNLRETNPVPIVINEINNISGYSVGIENLSRIISVLYENIIEYGPPEEYMHEMYPDKYKASNTRDVHDIFIRIGLKQVEHNGEPALLVRMQDNGKQLAHNMLMGSLRNGYSLNEEHPLVYEFKDVSNHDGVGNRFEALIYERT